MTFKDYGSSRFVVKSSNSAKQYWMKKIQDDKIGNAKMITRLAAWFSRKNMKFLLSINYLVWLVLSGIFFAVGEFLSKKFALNPKVILIVCILAVYSLGALAWLPAILQKNQLSIVGAIWSVLSLLTTVLIGILIFGEKLSVIGIVGIITAVIAVALLSLN